jgi:hypothetical protein
MIEAFEGNLTWLKVPLDLVSSLLSVGIVLWIRGRAFEEVFLRRAVIGIVLAKLIGCVLLYALVPLEGMASDAQQHYLPQALRALSGEIPLRDFTTSYGPLFPHLLVPGLLLWRSPGSIVFTMLVAETAMLLVYALRNRRAGFSGGWRVMFLYSLSPLSWYWVGVVGYNSVLIGFFSVLSLALAESRRDLASGFAAALGLLLSKITMILSWPAVVLFGPQRIVLRALPLAAALAAALVAPVLVDIDITARAANYRHSATSGNVWFLLCMLTGAELDSVAVKRLSMLALLLVLAPVCLRFAAERLRRGLEGFDSAAALLASVHLIFMILSYKTYPWYHAGALLFALHALLASDRFRPRHLAPLVFLGMVTHLEPRLWMLVRAEDPGLLSETGGALFALDLAMLSAMVYWTLLCIRRTRP